MVDLPEDPMPAVWNRMILTLLKKSMHYKVCADHRGGFIGVPHAG